MVVDHFDDKYDDEDDDDDDDDEDDEDDDDNNYDDNDDYYDTGLSWSNPHQQRLPVLIRLLRFGFNNFFLSLFFLLRELDLFVCISSLWALQCFILSHVEFHADSLPVALHIIF